MVSRRHFAEAAAGILLGAIAIAAIVSCVVTFLPAKADYRSIPAVNEIGMAADNHAPGADDTPGPRITSIPVLSWHQMDNHCQATAPMCTTPVFSTDSVTQRQFYDQLAWLYSSGYRSVTLAQYTRWAAGQHVVLPAKPVLLTVDDGIANFYAGATLPLQHFGFTMVSMVVSGFAQGAQDGVRQYQGWDATWTQLRNLPSGTWEFAFHAGPQGHTTNAAGCPFYACQQPGESVSAYEACVRQDIKAGLAAERRHLGARVNTQVWAVPFNDLAQAPDEPQSGTVPRKWLEGYAARQFAVVFVDGLTSRAGQHYRYEVHGSDSLSYFASQVQRANLYTRFPDPATGSARAGGRS